MKFITFLVVFLMTTICFANDFALDFSSGNYARIPISATLSEFNDSFTLEFWLYLTGGHSSDEVIVGNEYFAGNRFVVHTFSSKLWPSITDENIDWLGLSYNGSNIGDAIPYNANTWYHMAMTYDGSTFNFFLNGSLVYTEEGDLSTFGPTDSDITINRHTWAGGGSASSRLTGQLDELRISNIARYNSNFTVPNVEFTPDINTMGLWHFNEGSGSLAYDSSVNGNNANLIGAGWSSNVAPIIENTFNANFSASTTSGFIPLDVDFTDLSTPADSIISWQWDFQNDGVIDSFEQNPTYTYNTDGIFSVKLIVESATETDTLIKEDYITVTYSPPQNLTATPTLTDIELNWEQCYQPNILLYKIFRNTSPNPTTQIDATVHPTITYTDTNVNPNTTYYYRITGYTSTGEETDYSNEVSAQLLPQMAVNPTSFDLTVNSQSSNSILDSFDLENSGGGQINYSIVGSDDFDENINYCLEFDNDDYVKPPDSAIPNTNDYSFEFWAKRQGWDSRSNYNAIIGWGEYLDDKLDVSYNNITGNVYFGGWGTDFDSGYSFTLNEWFHIVVSVSGNIASLYIDSHDTNMNMDISNVVKTNFFFGRLIEQDGFIHNFYGQVDDIRIWDKALTLEEAELNKYTTLNGDEPNLISYWKFDENSGNIAFDMTNNQHNANIFNAQWMFDNNLSSTGSILSFNPSLGILNGGSRLTQNVIMTVDAEDLADGIYNTSADITHNDPNETNPYIIPITITVDRLAPDRITGLNASPTTTDITLNWDSSLASDLEKYYVYRSIVPDNPIYLNEVDPAITTYIDSSIPDEDESYYYWVSAIDVNENEGTLSDSVLTYLDIPATVENVNISFVNSDAILTWNPVTETVYGNPIQNLTGYIVYFTEKIYNADTLFSYLAFTPDTTYTHTYAGNFADNMFYKVTAYVGDLRVLNAIIGKYPKLEPGILNKLIAEKSFELLKPKKQRLKQ